MPTIYTFEKRNRWSLTIKKILYFSQNILVTTAVTELNEEVRQLQNSAGSVQIAQTLRPRNNRNHESRFGYMRNNDGIEAVRIMHLPCPIEERNRPAESVTRTFVIAIYNCLFS